VLAKKLTFVPALALVLIGFSADFHARKPQAILAAATVPGVRHQMQLTFCAGRAALEFDLPKQYRVSHSKRVDFEIFTIGSSSSALKGKADMLIYLGRSPSPRHPGHSNARAIETASGKVKVFSWRSESTNATTYFHEALIDGLFPRPQNALSPADRPRSALGTSPPAVPPPTVPKPLVPPACEEDIVAQIVVSGTDPKLVDGLMDAIRTLRSKRMDPSRF